MTQQDILDKLEKYGNVVVSDGQLIAFFDGEMVPLATVEKLRQAEDALRRITQLNIRDLLTDTRAGQTALALKRLWPE